MPFVRGYAKTLYCPLVGDLTTVERCYSCRYYIKRDMSFVFCHKELEDIFGRFEIVSKTPFVIKTRDGRIYKFVPENDMNTSAVFVEVKTGEVKKIRRPHGQKTR